MRKSERVEREDAEQERAEHRISALGLKSFGYQIPPPPQPLEGDPAEAEELQEGIPKVDLGDTDYQTFFS